MSRAPKKWVSSVAGLGGAKLTLTTTIATAHPKRGGKRDLFEVQATDSDGRDAGFARCITKDTPEAGTVCAVEWIRVHPTERSGGLGTKLYEELAKRACANDTPLASDSIRSKYSDAFWKKQFRKGRAFAIATEHSTAEQSSDRKARKGAESVISRSRRFVLHCPVDPTTVDLRRARAKRGKKR